MKKRMYKRVPYLLLISILLSLILAVTGCGTKKTIQEEQTEKRASLEPTIISIGGIDIQLGTTKLNELTNAGVMITWDDNLKEPIVADLEMPGRTYDVGIYFGKDDMVYGGLQCLNDSEEAIPYIDSIINLVEFHYTENTNPYSAPYYYEDIKINGMDLKGMKPDDIRAQFEEKLEKDEKISSTEYPDGSIAFLQFYYNNCYYSLGFNMETGLITKGTLEMFHSDF